MSVNSGRNGGDDYGVTLKLHGGDDDAVSQAAAGDSWRGDATVLCAVLARLGGDVEEWGLVAALKSLDALIARVFADTHDATGATAAQAEVAAWDRIVLLATLLGYREVLSALADRPQAMEQRLARYGAMRGFSAAE